MIFFNEHRQLSPGSSPHNCSIDHQDVAKKEIINTLKRKATESRLTDIQNVVTEVVSTITDDELTAALPQWPSLAKVCDRERAKVFGNASDPKTLQMLDVSDKEFKTARGHNFLLYSDPPRYEKKMLIFSTNKNIDYMIEAETLMVDGTFYVAPTLFYQSLSIHGFVGGKAIPLVYALLPDKKQKTYERFVDVMSRYLCTSSGKLMIDFELAIINAMQLNLPSYAILLCYFHLAQNLQKQISKKHRKRYRTDKDFATASRIMLMLCFVPLERLEEAIDAIIYYLSENFQCLLYVWKYFEDNYIGELIAPDRRQTPRYPPYLWNKYQTVIDGGDLLLSNNDVEGFHRSFKRKLTAPHPCISKYFQAIKDQQVKTDFYLTRLEKDINPDKRQRHNNTELIDIVKKCNSYETIIEYMLDLSKCHFVNVKFNIEDE